MFPFAQGVKNRVDIAWWDTREEDEALRPRPAGELPLIYDYVSGFSRVFRKASIYMTRVSGCKATTSEGACTPRQPTDDGFESPVRVSRYQTALLGGALQEVEANPLNLRTHGSGRLAYNGDYGAMGTRRFRRLPSGDLIQNSLPRQLGEDNFVANENMFLAWGENRDVFFGNAVANPDDPNAQFPYSPPGNAAPSLQAKNTSPEEFDSPDTLVAKGPDDIQGLKAVGEPDDELGQEPDADVVACSAIPSQNFSSSRDSNVYGSHVEDVPMLVAVTPTRQMNLTQRMFPLYLSNPATQQPGANFCLEIGNQPPDYLDGRGSGRASFDPLPARNNPDPDEFIAPREYLTVLVPPLGSASRALFVTSSSVDARITVNAYAGECEESQSAPPGPPEPPTLISSVQVGNGELFDPLFCQDNDTDPACINPVVTHETHNIGFAAPSLQAPIQEAPSLQAELLGAPSLQAEGLIAPSFQADGVEAPSLQAPSFQAGTFEANSLISPSLQAPSLQAPSLQAALLDPDESVYYQDLTFLVSANANVTTTYSADIAVQGLNADETQVELIAWLPSVHTATTVVDGQCLSVPESDNQVIAAVDLGSPSLQASSLNDVSLPFAKSPDDQEPYAGEISFVGKPGDQVAVTVRLWVTGESKKTLDRLYECSTAENPSPTLNCQPEETANGAFLLVPFGAAAHGCSTVDVLDTDPDIDCISAGAEKITPPDLFPPVFSPPDQGTIEVEAQSPAGATVNTPGTVPDGIVVTDADPDVTVTCVFGGTTTPLNDGTTDFDFGDTDVDCTASDSSFNTSTATITIAVVDSVAPEITVPTEPIGRGPVAAEGPGGAAVNFEVSATDITNTTIECRIPDGSPEGMLVYSGDTFPLGPTTVTCKATDQGGNQSAGTFEISVTDQDDPEITVPTEPIPAVEAEGPGGAAVTFSVDASDTIDPSVDIECRIPDGSPEGMLVYSGDTFPLGQTTVTCKATDDAGNSISGSFTVTVEDTTPPNFDPPLTDITVASGEPAEFTAQATDIVDTSVEVQCTIDGGATVVNSGDSFPTGTTEVSCTATDDGRFGDGADLNSITDSFTVTTLLGFTGVMPQQNPNNIKTGTSVPLVWAWLDDSNMPVDIGTGNQIFEVRNGKCDDLGELIFSEDPGSSGFQLMLDNSWQYNFQAIQPNGDPLPASRSGMPYCAIVTLMEGGTPVQQQDGDFTLKL